jgi:hypothetical protein
VTWDQGVEMGRHGEFTIATDLNAHARDQLSAVPGIAHTTITRSSLRSVRWVP